MDSQSSIKSTPSKKSLQKENPTPDIDKKTKITINSSQNELDSTKQKDKIKENLFKFLKENLKDINYAQAYLDYYRDHYKISDHTDLEESVLQVIHNLQKASKKHQSIKLTVTNLDEVIDDKKDQVSQKKKEKEENLKLRIENFKKHKQELHEFKKKQSQYLIKKDGIIINEKAENLIFDPKYVQLIQGKFWIIFEDLKPGDKVTLIYDHDKLDIINNQYTIYDQGNIKPIEPSFKFENEQQTLTFTIENLQLSIKNQLNQTLFTDLVENENSIDFGFPINSLFFASINKELSEQEHFLPLKKAQIIKDIHVHQVKTNIGKYIQLKLNNQTYIIPREHSLSLFFKQKYKKTEPKPQSDIICLLCGLKSLKKLKFENEVPFIKCCLCHKNLLDIQKKEAFFCSNCAYGYAFSFENGDNVYCYDCGSLPTPTPTPTQTLAHNPQKNKYHVLNNESLQQKEYLLSHRYQRNFEARQIHKFALTFIQKNEEKILVLRKLNYNQYQFYEPELNFFLEDDETQVEDKIFISQQDYILKIFSQDPSEQQKSIYNSQFIIENDKNEIQFSTKNIENQINPDHPLVWACLYCYRVQRYVPNKYCKLCNTQILCQNEFCCIKNDTLCSQCNYETIFSDFNIRRNPKLVKEQNNLTFTPLRYKKTYKRVQRHLFNVYVLNQTQSQFKYCHKCQCIYALKRLQPEILNFHQCQICGKSLKYENWGIRCRCIQKYYCQDCIIIPYNERSQTQKQLKVDRLGNQIITRQNTHQILWQQLSSNKILQNQIFYGKKDVFISQNRNFEALLIQDPTSKEYHLEIFRKFYFQEDLEYIKKKTRTNTTEIWYTLMEISALFSQILTNLPIYDLIFTNISKTRFKNEQNQPSFRTALFWTSNKNISQNILKERKQTYMKESQFTKDYESQSKSTDWKLNIKFGLKPEEKYIKIFKKNSNNNDKIENVESQEDLVKQEVKETEQNYTEILDIYQIFGGISKLIQRFAFQSNKIIYKSKQALVFFGLFVSFVMSLGVMLIFPLLTIILLVLLIRVYQQIRKNFSLQFIKHASTFLELNDTGYLFFKRRNKKIYITETLWQNETGAVPYLNLAMVIMQQKKQHLDFFINILLLVYNLYVFRASDQFFYYVSQYSVLILVLFIMIGIQAYKDYQIKNKLFIPAYLGNYICWSLFFIPSYDKDSLGVFIFSFLIVAQFICFYSLFEGQGPLKSFQNYQLLIQLLMTVPGFFLNLHSIFYQLPIIPSIDFNYASQIVSCCLAFTKIYQLVLRVIINVLQSDNFAITMFGRFGFNYKLQGQANHLFTLIMKASLFMNMLYYSLIWAVYSSVYRHQIMQQALPFLVILGTQIVIGIVFWFIIYKKISKRKLNKSLLSVGILLPASKFIFFDFSYIIVYMQKLQHLRNSDRQFIKYVGFMGLLSRLLFIIYTFYTILIDNCNQLSNQKYDETVYSTLITEGRLRKFISEYQFKQNYIEKEYKEEQISISLTGNQKLQNFQYQKDFYNTNYQSYTSQFMYFDQNSQMIFCEKDSVNCLSLKTQADCSKYQKSDFKCNIRYINFNNEYVPIFNINNQDYLQNEVQKTLFQTQKTENKGCSLDCAHYSSLPILETTVGPLSSCSTCQSSYDQNGIQTITYNSVTYITQDQLNSLKDSSNNCIDYKGCDYFLALSVIDQTKHTQKLGDFCYIFNQYQEKYETCGEIITDLREITKINQNKINFEKFGPYNYDGDYCEYMKDEVGNLLKYNFWIYIISIGSGLISQTIYYSCFYNRKKFNKVALDSKSK